MIKLLLIAFALLSPAIVSARVTPEDIFNSKKFDYQTKVAIYNPDNRQKLEILSKKISEINRARTLHLATITARQGEILDEYEKRLGFPEKHEGIKNARYWLTFAHEAVDYQAAKIYIFNLTSEDNIKTDALNLISLFQNDLNYAKSTVAKSQSFIEKLVYEK